MCLAVPGKVIALDKQDDLLFGTVDFGGIVKSVCLAYVPEVQINQYVMVHAGFAIQIVAEDEVQQFLQLWQEVENNIPQRREER